ncbi:MAG TPA: DUF58 domain-containing protein [Symbiobacteriaceae bacterium]
MIATSSRFAPAPRLALLVCLAGVPLLFGWTWLNGGLNAGLLVVTFVDWLLSRRRVEAVRKPAGVLSLGAENLMHLELRSPGVPVDLELRDDLPLPFALVGDWPKVKLGGSNWEAAGYRLRPGRRGQYAAGPLHGRYASPLGLWRRTLTWSLVEPVRVYPNLLAARQWEIAIRKGRHLEGLKRSRVRGGGTEFESLREYQPGDQYRAISWPASARSGKLITTLYQVDRSQPVMLLIDAGRMMIPQVKGITKLDHSLNAGLLLATVAAERGDQCGLMLFGGEVKAFMPPKKGRGQVLAMVEALYAVEPEQVEPDYGRMISWLRAKHKKRSLMVLFTDMVDPDISRGLVNHLSALASHHLVLLVCLSDPELLRLSRLTPTDSAEVYQKAAALEVLAQRAEIAALLQSRGVAVIDVPPEEFSTAVVNQYLTVKEEGRL